MDFHDVLAETTTSTKKLVAFAIQYLKLMATSPHFIPKQLLNSYYVLEVVIKALTDEFEDFKLKNQQNINSLMGVMVTDLLQQMNICPQDYPGFGSEAERYGFSCAMEISRGRQLCFEV